MIYPNWLNWSVLHRRGGGGGWTPMVDRTTTYSFDDSSGFSSATNWTGSGNTWTHTPGSTTALTSVYDNLIELHTYRFDVTISGATAGTVQPKAGSITGTASATSFTQFLRCGSSPYHAYIIPSSDFDGTIQITVDDVSIEKIDMWGDWGTFEPTGDPLYLREMPDNPGFYGLSANWGSQSLTSTLSPSSWEFLSRSNLAGSLFIVQYESTSLGYQTICSTYTTTVGYQGFYFGGGPRYFYHLRYCGGSTAYTYGNPGPGSIHVTELKHTLTSFQIWDDGVRVYNQNRSLGDCPNQYSLVLSPYYDGCVYDLYPVNTALSDPDSDVIRQELKAYYGTP